MIFNQSVPFHNVEKGTFVRLPIYYKCYSYHHKTSERPTPNVLAGTLIESAQITPPKNVSVVA